MAVVKARTSLGSVAIVSVDQIRAAYVSRGERTVEPLVSLMPPEMEWRGRRWGWRFWRPVPS